MLTLCTQIFRRFWCETASVIERGQHLVSHHQHPALNAFRTISFFNPLVSSEPQCQSILQPLSGCIVRQYHLLRSPSASDSRISFGGVAETAQVRSFKTKVRLKRRCKDCYFIYIKGREHVLCDTHPRHKQRKLQRKPEYYWILTHATAGTRRRW